MPLPISVSKYVRSIDSFQSESSTCPYCGYAIISKNPIEAICSFCEMASEEGQMKKLRSDVHGFIAAKNDMVASNMWQDAAKSAEQLVAMDPSPQMLYSCGIFYEMYSNHEWHDVDYNLGGYMEKNSVNRELSWQLLSRSKTLIYHAIKICHNTLASEPDYTLAYVKLVAESRVGRMAQAKITLGMINGDQNASIRKDYANMVYYSHLNDTKNAMQYLDYVSNTEPNAFYYLAKLLAKNKRADDAKRILLPLTKKIGLPKAKELLLKIQDSENTA